LAVKRVINLTVRWPDEAEQFESFRAQAEREVSALSRAAADIEYHGPKEVDGWQEYTMRISAPAPSHMDGSRVRRVLQDVVRLHRGEITSLRTLLSSDELVRSLGVNDAEVIDILIRSLRVSTMAGLAATNDDQIRRILKSDPDAVIAALKEYRATHPPSPRRFSRRRPANKQS
jgi:hypothetical protein